MKTLILLAALLISGTAFAQTSTSGASSGSQSTVHASQGNTQGTTVSITSNAAPIPVNSDVHYSGVDRTAPAVVTGGYAAGFSSDNCMNTAQIGASGPGFGLSFGHGTPDENCQQLRRVDAHGRLAQAYGVATSAGQLQLRLAAIDVCLADGYDRDSCLKNNP